MLIAFYADKPKFNKNVNYVEVNEQQSYEHNVVVHANPFADNLLFSRVKETTANITGSHQSTGLLFAKQLGSGALNTPLDPIQDFGNISWMFEPIPTHWSCSLLNNKEIVLRIVNASVHDAGLYVARVSNTLGDSLLLIRVIVKSEY